MTLELVPTEFECYDELTDTVFRVEMMDAQSATVNISRCFDVAAWDEASAKVREALVLMLGNAQRG